MNKNKNGKNLVLNSIISSNSKDTIKRMVGVDKGNTVDIEIFTKNNELLENKNKKTSKFTLDDVKKLIKQMERKNIIKPRDFVVNIPLIGRKLYEKAWLEQKKIDVLKEQLEKAENGTELDRQRFIDDLEPLLGKSKN